MASLKNFHVVNPTGDEKLDKSIENVFSTVFDKEIISVGSFVRKVYALLMCLCDLDAGLWVATLRYEQKHERFRFIIKFIDRAYMSEVVCSLANGVDYVSALAVVRQSFTRDKITKHAVSYAKACISANTNVYIYEKKLLKDDDDIAIWTMHTKPKPWYKKLFAKIAASTDRVVNKIDVLNYEL